MVTVQLETAMRTIVETNRQVFGNNFTTAGTHLRCVAWVNECHTPTSVCSFVSGELHELTPGDIGNVAADDFVARDLHFLYVQFFKGNKLVFADQLARLLMCKVLAPIGRTFV